MQAQLTASYARYNLLGAHNALPENSILRFGPSLCMGYIPRIPGMHPYQRALAIPGQTRALSVKATSTAGPQYMFTAFTGR